ncbi:MAG: cysteine synthase A [Kiritimatiellae bacterium]|nr:cysteine synthase A [Kiritimatiellia bacterium]
MACFDSILETVGKTPLVRLNRFNDGAATLFAKVEFFNPGGSVKDRVALEMVETAERDGVLKPGGLIIEPTSGNTGIGLALVAAVKGYRMILTMPDTMSEERRKLLAAYGAQIVLTPGAQGMRGAIEKALELQAQNPGSFIPQQFENPANPMAHRRTTAAEILADMEGVVDVLVAGVGTGGTLSGTGAALRQALPEIEIVAVEPDASAVISGGAPGAHKLQGIGAGFIPKNLDVSLITRVIPVSADAAGEAAREVAHREGLLVGISSGAALAAARQLSRDPAYAGKRIVVILPDGGDRYLSTWLFQA